MVDTIFQQQSDVGAARNIPGIDCCTLFMLPTNLLNLIGTGCYFQVVEEVLERHHHVAPSHPEHEPAVSRFLANLRSDGRRSINPSNACLSPRYPDATVEELAATDNICIICREEMTSSASKKIPCNHIFHASCLRSWFQRQQTCPTCRMNVLRNATSTQSAVARNAQPQAQAQAQQQQEPGAQQIPNCKLSYQTFRHFLWLYLSDMGHQTIFFFLQAGYSNFSGNKVDI